MLVAIFFPCDITLWYNFVCTVIYCCIYCFLVAVKVITLCRPVDSRLEHVDFESLLQCLSVDKLLQVFASILLERRIILIADKLRYYCCGEGQTAILIHNGWFRRLLKPPLAGVSIIKLIDVEGNVFTENHVTALCPTLLTVRIRKWTSKHSW